MVNHELFINELKLAIPKRYKQWDQEGRVWLIHEKYLSALIRITYKYFKIKSMQQQDTAYEKLLCNLMYDKRMTMKLAPFE